MDVESREPIVCRYEVIHSFRDKFCLKLKAKVLLLEKCG